MSEIRPATRASRPVVVGAVAYHPKAVTIWEDIRELFREGDPPLDYVLFSTYEAQVEALFRGMIDIAWNTPVAWVKCLRRSSGEAEPLVMRDSDVGFTSRLIGRAGSGLKGLPDLRGKKVGFGSRDSAQATILPEHFLFSQAGLRAGKEYQAIRIDADLGKHGDTGTSELEVVKALQAGKIDAGALGHSTWDQLVADGAADPSKLAPFWTSPPYSHCNFTALSSLNPERAQGFMKRLLVMDYAQPDVKRMMDLEGLKRWVPGRRTGYEELEKAMVEQRLL